MPITVPPFTSYQGTLFPLRGLWNATPEEGDRYAAAEIDWGSYPGLAVQLGVSGNSPVALTQIVALTVDNARCGSDTLYLFSDSGFTLSVPAHAGGTFPVFTNSLSFYAVALSAGPQDVTNLFIHNSMPPPVPVPASTAARAASVTSANLGNATTILLPAGTGGTLTGGSVTVTDTAAGAASATLTLQDGTGAVLWRAPLSLGAGNATLTLPLPAGLRFSNGLSLIVSGSAGFAAGSSATVNLSYSSP